MLGAIIAVIVIVFVKEITVYQFYQVGTVLV